MKRLVIGILAHVDAGKTTLSEGLLYKSGALRKLGAAAVQQRLGQGRFPGVDVGQYTYTTVLHNTKYSLMTDLQTFLSDVLFSISNFHKRFSSAGIRSPQSGMCAVVSRKISLLLVFAYIMADFLPFFNAGLQLFFDAFG